MYCVSASGIDGSGKSTAIDSVSRRLSREGYCIAQIGRPSFIENKNGKRYVAAKTNFFFDYLHELADAKRARTAVGLISAAYRPVVGYLSRVMKLSNPDLMIFSRDSWLDPFAYSCFYFPWTRSLRPEEKAGLISMIAPSWRIDHVFYLDIEPGLAYERIIARIKENPKRERTKWQHMHENTHDLESIRREFETGIPFRRAFQETPLTRIDASGSKDDVLDELYEALALPMKQRYTKGSRDDPVFG